MVKRPENYEAPGIDNHTSSVSNKIFIFFTYCAVVCVAVRNTGCPAGILYPRCNAMMKTKWTSLQEVLIVAQTHGHPSHRMYVSRAGRMVGLSWCTTQCGPPPLLSLTKPQIKRQARPTSSPSSTVSVHAYDSSAAALQVGLPQENTAAPQFTGQRQ